MNLTGRLPIWLVHVSSSGAPEEDRVRLQTVRPAASPPAEPGSSSPVSDPGKGPARLSEEEQRDRQYIRKTAIQVLDCQDELDKVNDLREVVNVVEEAATARYRTILLRRGDETPEWKKMTLLLIVLDECRKARKPISSDQALEALLADQTDPIVALRAYREMYRQLPPEGQVIMALHNRAASIEELAQVLGRSVPFVKKQLNHFRNRLRDEKGKK